MTVFIHRARGTPRSADLNGKYQEKYLYLEIFRVKFFAENYFSNNMKLFSLAMQFYVFIVITF